MFGKFLAGSRTRAFAAVTCGTVVGAIALLLIHRYEKSLFNPFKRFFVIVPQPVFAL